MKKLFRTTESSVRQPRFELHLKIYDLNNVPLVAGWSLVKWHIVHSMHAEHKGTTERCAIANHRVHYAYSKAIGSVRIPIDKSQRLSEYWLQLEVLQEYSSSGMRDEKVPLGIVRVNLSEFVEESMNVDFSGLTRRRPGATTALTTPVAMPGEEDVHDGIVRRYLLQESKINSTLKIGILMVQVDGDRNFVAPPLKTAPVFGGLTGIMVGEAPEPDDGNKVPTMTSSKSRDVSEADLYRSMLIASWHCPPDELHANEAIEEIFLDPPGSSTRLWASHYNRPPHPFPTPSHITMSMRPHRDSDISGDDGYTSSIPFPGSTLRANDIRRISRHRRLDSVLTEVTAASTTGFHRPGPLTLGAALPVQDYVSRRAPDTPKIHRRQLSRGDDYPMGGRRSRSGSFTSLASADGSVDERGRDVGLGYRVVREVREDDVRDNMVAWTMPKSMLIV